MAIGVFNSADAQKGTVNISHQPVPSASWPAMTMDFKLGSNAAVDHLKPGDRVDIHFTIESGMNATVTSIAPID
jgi:Cu/Ag efflux protein CusF